MFLAIKIILTITIVVFEARCMSFIIEEIKYYKNWIHAALTMVLVVIAAIDIWLMWFM